MLLPEEFYEICRIAAERCGPAWSVSRGDFIALPGSHSGMGVAATACVFSRSNPEARISAALIGPSAGKAGMYDITVSVAPLRRGRFKLVYPAAVRDGNVFGSCDVHGRAPLSTMAVFIASRLEAIAPLAIDVFPAQLAELDALSARVDAAQAVADQLSGWGFRENDSPFAQSPDDFPGTYRLALPDGMEITVRTPPVDALQPEQAKDMSRKQATCGVYVEVEPSRLAEVLGALMPSGHL